MSNKTITKKSSFVILFIIIIGIFSACHSAASSGAPNANQNNKNLSKDYEKAKVVGGIETDEITESSGLAASRCQTDVLWTHNDSGDGAFLFALNTKGEKLGVWEVRSAKNRDWEDLATFKDADGECFLYIGDIGDNQRKRENVTVYKVKEPTISAAGKDSSRKNPLASEAAETIDIEYPDGARDAETLLVHPQTGDVYVLSKSLRNPSSVYKLTKNYSLEKTNRLEKITDFTIPSIPFGFLTGGGIAPDGKRVIIADYLAAYEIVLPDAAKNFDDIWREKPLIVDLGEREQGEAISYAADGKAIYATSEKKNSPIIEVRKN